jgi:hypothetical protein
MFGGQRQTWSLYNIPPPTYWISTYVNTSTITSVAPYDTNQLVVGSEQGSGSGITGQLQVLNLNGSLIKKANTSAGVRIDRIAPSGTNIYVSGDYILGGSYWAGWIAKFDSDLNITWQKFFRDGSTYFSDMALCPDGGIIICGTAVASTGDGFLLKLNSSGSVSWSVAIGNGSLDNQFVAVDSSNNVYSALGDGTYNYLAKYDSSGTLLWSYRYYRTINPVFVSALYVDENDDPWLSFYGAYRATLMPVYAADGIPKNQYAYYNDSYPSASDFYFDSMVGDGTGNIIASGSLSTLGVYLNTGISPVITNWVGTIDSTANRDINIAQTALSGNLDIYSVANNGDNETIFALGNNFSTVGSYNNYGDVLVIQTGNLTQQAGNITTLAGGVTPGSFTSSSFVSGNVTVSSSASFGIAFTPIRTPQINPAPPPSSSIEYLAVAGGGGTPARIGGGGGGGGVVSGTYSAVTAGTVITVTVGAGGLGRLGSNDPQAGTNGGDTTLAGSGLTTITAVGGGAGGMVNGLTYIYPGTGGSGGGGSTGENLMSPAGAAGTSGQGYAGGTGYAAPIYSGGGGGGAGAVGNNSASSGTQAPDGGAGIASSITGSSVYYGGGGGAGCYGAGVGTGGAGGLGGGGAGGNTFSSGTNGTANTGGGGGATGGGDFAPSAKGGDGGSGVGILRLLTSKYTGTTTGSPTVTTDGSYTVISYTSTGTYTA